MKIGDVSRGPFLVPARDSEEEEHRSKRHWRLNPTDAASLFLLPFYIYKKRETRLETPTAVQLPFHFIFNN